MTVSLAPLTLLVEDEDEVAESYLASFKDEGLAVDHATTWDDALDRFRAAGHELVIADYNLPGSELGLQLLVAMKRLIPYSRLILISGAMSPRSENLAKSVDFIDGFYAKTSTLGDTLLAEVRLAADRSSEQTDWRAFGAGYLADPSVDDPDLELIDNALREDVEGGV